MESIDDLLDQVKAEYQEKAQPQERKQPTPSKVEKITRPQAVTPAQPYGWEKQVSSVDDPLLSQIKAEFEEQDRAEQLKKQQQLREEQLKAEQRKRQQREALKREAQVWVKNLKPHSDEYLWFKEFATAYPSEVDAAIDYLQALRETQP